MNKLLITAFGKEENYNKGIRYFKWSEKLHFFFCSSLLKQMNKQKTYNLMLVRNKYKITKRVMTLNNDYKMTRIQYNIHNIIQYNGRG